MAVPADDGLVTTDLSDPSMSATLSGLTDQRRSLRRFRIVGLPPVHPLQEFTSGIMVNIGDVLETNSPLGDQSLRLTCLPVGGRCQQPIPVSVEANELTTFSLDMATA
jgi:hypothetical protein